MEKNKLKPTQVSLQKKLKPSSIEEGSVVNINNNKINTAKNISEEPIIKHEKSENKLLEDRDYNDLEI